MIEDDVAVIVDDGVDPLDWEPIGRFANTRPDDPVEVVAAAYVATLAVEHLRRFAQRHVKKEVELHRRLAALRVERHAQIAAEQARLEQWERERPEREAREAAERAERKAAREEKKAEAAREYRWRLERMRDHPQAQGYGIVQPWQARNIEAFCLDFRAWMGEAFPGWYEDSLARLSEGATTRAGRRSVEHFRADWEPDYPRPEWTMNGEINEMLADHADSVRLEVTEELLRSEFGLGDGTRTTWGEATIAQHQQRADLLVKGAAGTLETASRHREAIRMIRERGATCLREATRFRRLAQSRQEVTTAIS